MPMYKTISILILGLIIVGTLFFFRQRFLPNLFGPVNSEIKETDPHIRLSEKNSLYQQAEDLRTSSGNSQQVIDLYWQALRATTDPEERGQIEFKIASTGVRIDTNASIDQLKALAADNSQSNLQRANALQQLGQTYYKNTNKDIVASIFSGEPYVDFYAERDVHLALRRLFEYASSFYPLAISELRAARWYANSVYDLRQKKRISIDEQIRIDSYLSIIREKLALAEADIRRTTNAPNAKNLIPDALARKAGVIGVLSLAGEESFDNPDGAFREAINGAVLIKGDGPPRVAYARYLLAKYGESRKNDIGTILTPLMLDIKNYPEGIKIYLGAERNNVLGQKKELISLASLIPDFKKTLLLLGWSETDFTP